MPTLTLKYKESSVREYDFQKDKSLTIGRNDSNDVIIENLAVSGRHAKIDQMEDGFLLTDLKSTNGTFVNERLVSSHSLKHGDVIVIGKHTLVFAYREGEAQPEPVPEEMDQTMIMDTEEYRSLLQKNIPKPVIQPSTTEPSGSLSFLSGGEGEIELSKKLTKIGKSPTCDIVTSGLTVGKIAATISKRPAGYYLSYVGGMAKPKINGQIVKESAKLNEFDTIEIGPLKAEFIFQK